MHSRWALKNEEQIAFANGRDGKAGQTVMTEQTATTTTDREVAAKAMAARLSNHVVVGGSLTEAITDETFPVENPANGETIGSAPRCGVADVNRAVDAASSAFPAWAALPTRQRSSIMLAMADRLEREVESLAQLSSLETGNALPRRRAAKRRRWSTSCASTLAWRAR